MIAAGTTNLRYKISILISAIIKFIWLKTRAAPLNLHYMYLPYVASTHDSMHLTLCPNPVLQEKAFQICILKLFLVYDVLVCVEFHQTCCPQYFQNQPHQRHYFFFSIIKIADC